MTMTEKKPRTPKPAMTPEVGDFIRLYLPFLSAATDEARIIAAVDIGLDLEELRFSLKVRKTQEGQKVVYGVSNRDSYIAKAQEEWNITDFAHLRETRDKIASAIYYMTYNSFSVLPDEKVSDELAKLLQGEPATYQDVDGPIVFCSQKWPEGFGKEPDGLELAEWLENSASMYQWRVPWHVARQESEKRNPLSKWPERIRAWGASMVIRIFSGGIGVRLRNGDLDTIEPSDAPASWFIGACPRCGKIFEKKRGDQEFCSRACLEVVAKRRQRTSKSTY